MFRFVFESAVFPRETEEGSQETEQQMATFHLNSEDESSFRGREKYNEAVLPLERFCGPEHEQQPSGPHRNSALRAHKEAKL